MFKFQNYSAIKNAQDNPRVRATALTKNGYVFGVKDNYEVDEGVIYSEAAVPFADADAAKAGDVWVAINIIDKPELMNTSDYVINTGEYIRAFNLSKLHGEKVEITSDIVIDDYANVAVGDKLIPANATDNDSAPMKWKKATDTDTGYSVCLEVTAKTTFGVFTIDGSVGGGFECKITSSVHITELINQISELNNKINDLNSSPNN